MLMMQWILAIVLLLSSFGVILLHNPVHASLSFLLTLLSLATLYLQLHAEFIAVMQVLVYAGAILVLFMFVIILFQDAHQQIEKNQSRSSTFLLAFSAALLVIGLLFLGVELAGIIPQAKNLPEGFGSVQALGRLLFTDFFFPFEAIILM